MWILWTKGVASFIILSYSRQQQFNLCSYDLISCGETAFKFWFLCEASRVSFDPLEKLPQKRVGVGDSVPTPRSPRYSVCTDNSAYRKMMHEDCSAPFTPPA